MFRRLLLYAAVVIFGIVQYPHINNNPPFTPKSTYTGTYGEDGLSGAKHVYHSAVDSQLGAWIKVRFWAPLLPVLVRAAGSGANTGINTGTGNWSNVLLGTHCGELLSLTATWVSAASTIGPAQDLPHLLSDMRLAEFQTGWEQLSLAVSSLEIRNVLQLEIHTQGRRVPYSYGVAVAAVMYRLSRAVGADAAALKDALGPYLAKSCRATAIRAFHADGQQKLLLQVRASYYHVYQAYHLHRYSRRIPSSPAQPCFSTSNYLSIITLDLPLSTLFHMSLFRHKLPSPGSWPSRWLDVRNTKRSTRRCCR